MDQVSGRFVLKLFVTGQTSRSQHAIANLHRIAEEEFPGMFHIQIIDVLENPEVAEEMRVLATPTLIKELPPPIRRIIGDLSDSEKVLAGLGIARVTEPHPPSRSA